jgi:hypothetical protein
MDGCVSSYYVPFPRNDLAECKWLTPLLGCPADVEAGQLLPNLHFLSKTVQEPALPAGCDRIQLSPVPKSSA